MKQRRDQKPQRNKHSDRERASADSGLFVVEGMASVAEYLRFRPKAVKRVFALKSALRNYGEQLKALPAEVLVLDDRAESTEGVGDSSRRSPVWAEVAVAAIGDDELIARISSREKDLILALDHVLDPRNLGAIVRSAAFFGVREVLVAERRQALLSNAAVNTAQGGFSLTDLCVTVNVGRMVERLKEKGYWVIGADMRGEPLQSVVGFYDKVVLILGAEESGLSPGVRSKCDRIVSIAGPAGGLESLNVSVAAGVILHSLAGEVPQ